LSGNKDSEHPALVRGLLAVVAVLTATVAGLLAGLMSSLAGISLPMAVAAGMATFFTALIAVVALMSFAASA
jgi:hypothetical protein